MAFSLRRMSEAELVPGTLGVVEDEAAIREIIVAVRREGDAALRRFARKWDKVELPEIRSTQFAKGKLADLSLASAVDDEGRAALQRSAERIRRFAQAQRDQLQDFTLEIEPGVFLGQRVEPVSSAAVYVPAGRYPLLSTVLMGVIPAKVAGVKRVAVMTPPGPEGRAHPAILVAAQIAGADEVFVSGGAHAVAALAWGTESVMPVDVIVGPGNQWVAGAKAVASRVVGIDFYAGPSEVMVVADDASDAGLVAADLLAQAEHDPAARAVLVTDSPALVERVEAEVERRLALLATADVARSALERNGGVVLLDDLTRAPAIAWAMAPEHLELHTADARQKAPLYDRYGSLFIGGESGEVLGDYSAGLNHTLPTAGAARHSGGLSVRDFLCVRTTLEARPGSGLEAVAHDAATMAGMENLAAHKAAAEGRLR